MLETMQLKMPNKPQKFQEANKNKNNLNMNQKVTIHILDFSRPRIFLHEFRHKLVPFSDHLLVESIDKNW